MSFSTISGEHLVVLLVYVGDAVTQGVSHLLSIR